MDITFPAYTQGFGFGMALAAGFAALYGDALGLIALVGLTFVGVSLILERLAEPQRDIEEEILGEH